MTDDHNNNSDLSAAFADVNAIDIACALKEMIGQDVDASDLRAHYEGADDETILRIVDTLHVYRFDWMENTKQTLNELCSKLPENLHAQILDEALDLALMRLKHIGFLQQSGRYFQDSEEDINREGKDRFPELYDASEEAEHHTCNAIQQIILMRLGDGPRPQFRPAVLQIKMP